MKIESLVPLVEPPTGLREDVALAPLTSWQVGGAARYFIEPTCVDDVRAAVAWATKKGLPWAVIGRGSNLLASDAGWPGLVIRMANRFAKVTFAPAAEGRGTMVAQAGAPLAQMVMAGLNAGFGGLEPMVGVPGTVGGAIAMNASAHHVAISEGFLHGDVLLADGRVETWAADRFEFRYRHSVLHDLQAVFLEGTWDLPAVDKAAGRARVMELQQWRNQKQPTNFPTGGSTFRNPGDGHPAAGALLEQCGAKGLRVGGAEVSAKHANFIVNTGAATAADIHGLICLLQERVLASHGVLLCPEVCGLGMDVGLPRGS